VLTRSGGCTCYAEYIVPAQSAAGRRKALGCAAIVLACAGGLVVSIDSLGAAFVEGSRTFIVRLVPSTQRVRRGLLVRAHRRRDGDCDAYSLLRSDGALAGDELEARVHQRVSWEASLLLARRSNATFSDDDHVCGWIMYVDGTICVYNEPLMRTAEGLQASFSERWPCAAPVLDRDDEAMLEDELLRKLPGLRQLPNFGLERTKIAE
jgi:hypothetical protein